MLNTFMIRNYLAYKMLSKHKSGHGIHSPFVYKFIRDIIRTPTPHHIKNEILGYRKALKNNYTKIKITHPGASSYHKQKDKTISNLFRHHSIKEKYTLLLYRLASNLGQEAILELGTSTGNSTLSLALTGRKVTTIEACESIYDFVHQELSPYTNIDFVHSTFPKDLDNLLQNKRFDFILIDGNHQYQPTIEMVSKIIKHNPGDCVIVIDDIYWSKAMADAWKQIQTLPEVVLTIDICQFGIIINRRGIEKQHFRIRF